MNPNFLLYKDSKIAWRRFGTGPQPVICFHGYGETAESFQFLTNADSQFSFYAIDLPFHGETDWKEGLIFTHVQLEEIILAIVEKTDLSYSVMGFSMGGRVALSLFQSIPGKIAKLVLLAPDGLKVNFWYRLATRTKIGNRIFSYTMKHPGWFFGFLKLLNKLRLVNKSIFKFVNYYIGDEKLRIELYSRWTSLRKLKPNIPLIKDFVRKYKTPTRLVYGKHDRIILSSVGEKFRKGVEDYCEVRLIEAGHQVLHEKHAREILAALQH